MRKSRDGTPPCKAGWEQSSWLDPWKLQSEWVRQPGAAGWWGRCDRQPTLRMAWWGGSLWHHTQHQGGTEVGSQHWWVQKRCNSSASAMELHLFWTPTMLTHSTKEGGLRWGASIGGCKKMQHQRISNGVTSLLHPSMLAHSTKEGGLVWGASVGGCKRDVTPVCQQWSYISFAPNNVDTQHQGRRTEVGSQYWWVQKNATPAHQQWSYISFAPLNAGTQHQGRGAGVGSQRWWVQKRCNSSVSAMELHLFCTHQSWHTVPRKEDWSGEPALVGAKEI